MVRRKRRISRSIISISRKSRTSPRISSFSLGFLSFLASFSSHSPPPTAVICFFGGGVVVGVCVWGGAFYSSFSSLHILRNLPRSELSLLIQNMRIPNRLIPRSVVVRNPRYIYPKSGCRFFLKFHPMLLRSFVLILSLGASEFPSVLRDLLPKPSGNRPFTVFADRRIAPPPRKRFKSIEPNRTPRVSVFA